MLEGNVEGDFIYATILGGDLVHFGYSALRPVVLPVRTSAKSYVLLDVSELRTNGFDHMASWLDKAQKLWKERRTKKPLNDFHASLKDLITMVCCLFKI